MSDIFGRSTIAPTDVITKKQISSMIRKYVTSRLNLVDVDPGEIVVFGDKQGKLKTSDISLDSLLTIPKDAADDSIAVFKQGKITAGDRLSTITSSVKQLRNEYEAHVANFTQLRRNFNTADNTIEKFFGKKNIKPDEVTTTLPDLKKSIEDIKKVTDKVKIPHDTNDVKGLSYVVYQQLDREYLNPHEEIIQLQLQNKITVVGFYRFTIFSEHQLNILITVSSFSTPGLSKIVHKGTNTVLLYVTDAKNNYYRAHITPVDNNVVRAKFGCILEYVSAIDNV